MPQIQFNLPTYESAFSEFVDSVMDGVRTLHPLLGKVSMRTAIHSGPIRNVSGPDPVDHPLEDMEQSQLISADVIRNSQISEFTQALYEMASEHVGEMARQMLKIVSDITDATGNVVNAEGRPFTYDLYLQMLEKTEIGFDAEGNPILPRLVMSPATAEKLAGIKPTSEQLQRETEILREKRAKHDAQKRTRRLSR